MKIFLFFSLLIFYCTNSSAQEPYIYDQPIEGRKFYFPADHGSHPNFKTEWWYFTGQLYQDKELPFKDKPSFGYQLTFFRANNGGEQGYLAHAAITDFRNNTHIFHSLTSPESYNFAGASLDRFKVWNRSWSVEQSADKIIAKFSLPNYASVNLVLTPKTLPVLHGENGYSKKGPCLNCASHYLSYPMLDVSAQINFKNGLITKLLGVSWMDHEFMTNSLQPSQIGWDWFSIMLKDNRQLMLFRVRDKDPNNNFYSGSLIQTNPESKQSIVTQLTTNDFTLTETAFWQSDKTKAKYPSSWRIQVPASDIDIAVKTRTSNQELVFPGQKASAYYEGAISNENESVIGYVELTGYAEPLNALSSLDG